MTKWNGINVMAALGRAIPEITITYIGEMGIWSIPGDR